MKIIFDPQIFSSQRFGLPALEAFAANCPVICSDIPVFHEVCGDAALYFQPDSAAQLADAMKENIKDRFTENIAKQRAKFSWQKCAAETRCVYENVLQKTSEEKTFQDAGRVFYHFQKKNQTGF